MANFQLPGRGYVAGLTGSRQLPGAGYLIIGATGPVATITVSTDDAVFAGGASVATSSAQLAVTTDDAVFSGAAGATPGSITFRLRNNTGQVLASATGVVVNIWHPTTGALIARLTGLSSDALGYVTASSLYLSAGQSVVFEPDLTAAGLGRRLPTATVA